jgi:hypothetical protein
MPLPDAGPKHDAGPLARRPRWPTVDAGCTEAPARVPALPKGWRDRDAHAGSMDCTPRRRERGGSARESSSKKVEICSTGCKSLHSIGKGGRQISSFSAVHGVHPRFLERCRVPNKDRPEQEASRLREERASGSTAHQAVPQTLPHRSAHSAAQAPPGS